MNHSSRRSFLGTTLGFGLSLLSARLAEREAFAAAGAPPGLGSFAGRPPSPAKRIIVLYMNGGPSHIDTWDPKNGATGGKHKSIATRAPGVRICEHMPRLAEMGDKLAIVRGLSSKEGNHQRAQYLMHTGYSPNPTVAHPSLGGWLSKKLGRLPNGMPSFVSIGGPSLGAGFLGVEHGPFVLPRGGGMPQNIVTAQDTNEDRFQRRYAALQAMETRFGAKTGEIKVEGRRELYSRAVAMMRAPDLQAFDLSHETDATKAAFGDSDFGRGCLTAVRLAQSGVQCTEVVLDGWDTHKDNFTRTANLMKAMDPAMSALLTELGTRTMPSESVPMLATTLVLWIGDFGRTPKINPDDGRDHFPAAASAVLAGGGIKTGQAFGETDAYGAKVVKDLVTLPNLMATIVQAMGLAPDESFMTPVGRPIALTDSGAPIQALLR